LQINVGISQRLVMSSKVTPCAAERRDWRKRYPPLFAADNPAFADIADTSKGHNQLIGDTAQGHRIVIIVLRGKRQQNDRTLSISTGDTFQWVTPGGIRFWLDMSLSRS